MANTKITTNVIADDAITTAKIADDAVGNDQLASGLTLGGNTTATIIGNVTGNLTGNASGTAATVTGAAQTNITSLGTLTALTVDDITIDGSTISDAGEFTLDIGADIILDSDNGVWRFKDAGTSMLEIARDGSSYLNFYSAVSNMAMQFKGNDGGSPVTALALDMQNGGNATFSGSVTAADLLKASTNGSSAAELDIVSGATWTVRSNPTSGTNSYGLDIIKGSAGTDVKMSINSSGNVGIGTGTPVHDLHIHKAATGSQSRIQLTNGNTGATNADGYAMAMETDGRVYHWLYENAYMQFATNNTERMRIRANGSVGIGTAGYDSQILAVNAGTGDTVLYGESTDANCFASFRDNSSTANISYGAIGNNHVFRADNNERMRIDSSGRLIIGTTIQASGYSTPGGNAGENSHYAKLWIQGNTSTTAGDGRLVLASGTSWPSSSTQIGSIWFSTAWGGDHASIRAVTNGGTGNTDYPASLHFDTTPDGGSSPSERMVIRMDGGISIPASSTNSGASINGWISHHTNNHFYIRGGTEALHLMTGNPEASQSRIYMPGGANNSQWTINNNQVFNLSSGGALLIAGALTQNYSFSDIKLKTDIEDLPSALENLKTLKPISFNWKQESKRRETKEIGIIAQELQKVYPELVEERTRLLGEKDEMEQALHVEYDKLTVVLLKAIQELSAEVESLKEKLNG